MREAEERIEELESGEGKVAAEFEGELWKVFRTLLESNPGFDWRNYDDGVTADDVLQFFAEDMREAWRHAERQSARAERLAALLREAREELPHTSIAAIHIPGEPEIIPLPRRIDAELAKGGDPKVRAQHAADAETIRKLREALRPFVRGFENGYANDRTPNEDKYAVVDCTVGDGRRAARILAETGTNDERPLHHGRGDDRPPPSTKEEPDMTADRTAIEQICDERRRQIEVEGWTPEHDDTHKYGELARAAAAYARHASCGDEVRRESTKHGVPPMVWPWSQSWWKPKDRRSDLVRAAALIVAEIERLDRAAAKS